MRPLILVAAIVIASCTRPAEPPGTAFARELSGRVASAPEVCISTISTQNLRAIDSRTIVYGYGPTIYVNRLPGSCIMLIEALSLPQTAIWLCWLHWVSR